MLAQGTCYNVCHSTHSTRRKLSQRYQVLAPELHKVISFLTDIFVGRSGYQGYRCWVARLLLLGAKVTTAGYQGYRCWVPRLPLVFPFFFFFFQNLPQPIVAVEEVEEEEEEEEEVGYLDNR